MDRKPRAARRARLPLLACLAAGMVAFGLSGRGQQRGPTRSPHGPLTIPCASCHTDTSWSPLRAIPEFNHNRETRYPLRGMHENVQCKLCHTKLVFSDVGRKCADCHADIHRRQFGARCEECHTVKGWNVGVQAVREHSARFPLVGAHAATDCESCHRGAAAAQFTGLSTDCYSCHQKQFNDTSVVDHRAAGFPTDCKSCHALDGWRAVNFDHGRFTGFQLVGAHAKLDCASCHVGSRFKNTPAECFSCHAKEYNGTDNPNHAAASFPKDCAVCHSASSWAGAKFDHTAMTKFALTGAHEKVSCAGCHVGGRFAGTPASCYGCHAATFNATTNPDHRKGGFATDCSQCHTTADWQNAKFDHSITKFALTGAHAALQCTRCHTGNNFNNASTQCASCHLTNFQKTTNPNHVTAGFSQDCSTCHSTTNWQNAKFDHATTKFPLTGAHATVQCTQCHVGNNFNSVATQCSSCHLADFQKTTSPNHAAAGFPQDCSTCHNTTAWTGAKFDHSAATKFPLTGAHIQTACTQCHVGNKFAGTPTNCVGCHLDAFNKTTDPNHAAAGFPQDCATCHNTAAWTGAKFDHTALTKFPLTGAHVQVACTQCHVGNKFAGTATDCAGCHLADFTKTTNPNHAAAGFPQNCTMCHNTAAWQPATFDHAKTGFALTGAHVQAQCTQCHVGGKFAGTPTNCASCHLDAFNKTTDPNHAAAGFPQDCSVCHNTAAWTGAKFDHTALTKFPLTGAHVQVTCIQCHVGNKFAGTTTDCAGCHLQDFQKTTNPNHVAAGFPQNCTVCHNTAAWRPATFDHAKTGFALTGAHLQAQCAQCHVGGKFAGTPTNCVACHLPDFQKTTNPNHVAAGFPQDCSACHNTAAWTGAKFDHTALTKFPLTGAHVQVACIQCHVGNKFAGTTTDCAGCHLTDFQKTTNPNHVSAGFPQNCTVCHNTAAWRPATFDHAKTGFALTGAHLQAQCAQCHVGNKFAGTPTNCVGCHLPDFQKTTNPNHVAAGFPQDCSVCHNTAGWTGAKFDHTALTKFPLTGAHVQVPCSQCHVGNKFAGTPTNCVGCHLPDYQKTTNPNHVAAGFPQDCSVCHNTAGWTGAKFDHTALTKFPLTGAHVQVPCSQCHVGNKFAGTPTNCVGCHLTDYQNTTNPNHVAAGFPQDCSVCHNTAGWTGAKFDHTALTKFPLTGAHVQVPCSQCHVGNKFAGTPTNCVGCHLTDYQKTTNPNHVAAGFPQDCSVCHNTAGWTGAKFDHTALTKFPLTGAHVQVPCTQCHVGNKFVGTPTDCASCHVGDFNKTTNPNHVAAGFPQTCMICHNTSAWQPATFDHAKTGFALTGVHLQTPCAQCHVGNKFAGTPTNCVACHLTDFQKTTNPNHVSAGFPQDCSVCHNTAGWTGAKFDHSALTKFPLTGAHVQVPCTQCHVGNKFAGTPTDCAACHIADFTKTTSPNHTAAGFPQTCTLCHNTSAWQPATFDHAKTGFALTGIHLQTPCAQCHVNNKFAGTATQCSACHISSYNSTTNPNHAAAGFPTDCSICHSTAGWTGATFNHATTQFPLTGAHTSVQCAQCHKNNQFVGLPTTCVSCHLANYNATTNPNHVSAGFPQQCQVCHTTTAWTPASFNHSSTAFPLTGAHTSVQCSNCHINNVFAGTPTDCYSCHKAQYQSVSNPNHVAAGFPTTCTDCHTTTAWTGAVFTHSDFPIYSGTHAGKWTTCGDCHTNPSNYAVFECINCHTHNKTTTDSHHTGVKNYVYASANCYACHPTGRSD